MDIPDEIWKNFLKHIQFNLFPVDGKKYREFLEGNNPDFWVRDWTEIEIAKCFLLGDHQYKLDPPPRRCILSRNFSFESIINGKNDLIKRSKEVSERCIDDFIIDWNVGRGIPIILARSLGKWKSYICYDEDKRYGPLLKSFFSNENIVFEEKILKG